MMQATVSMVELLIMVNLRCSAFGWDNAFIDFMRRVKPKLC